LPSGLGTGVGTVGTLLWYVILTLLWPGRNYTATSFLRNTNELSQSLVRYCSVEDTTIEGTVCC